MVGLFSKKLHPPPIQFTNEKRPTKPLEHQIVPSYQADLVLLASWLFFFLEWYCGGQEVNANLSSAQNMQLLILSTQPIIMAVLRYILYVDRCSIFSKLHF